MLRLYTSRSASAVKSYFAAADYYTQGSEVVGRWGGELAARLGLSGQVTKEAFERLCDNLHPLTGERLTARTNASRRVGDDFILSLPKDVGAAIMLAPAGERDALLEIAGGRAHQVMEAVQADVQTRVRKHGAFLNRDTGNMLWAEFLHTTARPVDGRPPDPHPHWHMFAFNATHDPAEGRIKAIELGNVYRDRPYYEALFFSLVARDFADRGYAIERREGGRWGFAGLERLAGTFSKRTDEIEAEAERQGITAPSQKAELGARTRAAKQKELTPEQLRTAWIAQLSGDDREALIRVYGRNQGMGEEVTAKEAVAYAIDHLSEQRSLFAERELVRQALLFGLGRVSLGQIEAELPRQGIIAGEVDGEHGRRFVTTEALREEERYLVRRAAGGGQAVPVGVAAGLERGTLNDEQWRLSQELLETSARVSLVEGPAGAGKSYSLGKFDEGVKRAGQKVSYLATTATAAEVLKKDGFAAHTVAHFLRAEKSQQAAAGGRLVIDESSMLGHKDAVRLFQIAEKQNIKMVFVGDPMQHGSVPRGSFLRVMKDHAGLQSHRLTQIMRQEDPDYRAAAMLLAEGRTLEGFDALDRKEWVKEIGDSAERCRAMAADYVRTVLGGETCLVISPTHAEAKSITAEIRSQLKAAGRLGQDETVFKQLVNAQASEAERGQAWTYRAGDVLIFHSEAEGHAKGERLRVSDPALVPLEHAGKFSLYREQELALAAGDRIRFTGQVKAMRTNKTYKNGDTHEVAEITKGGNIRLDDGSVISRNAGLFRSAFCETSYGAQGQTVKRAILGMSAESLAATNQEQMYVSASRARLSVHVYTDDKEAVRSGIQASGRKHAALDLVPLPPKRDWRKGDADHRRRLGLWKRLQAACLASRMPERPSPGGGRLPPPVARPLEQAREYGHGR